jgi:hypothetical protein
MSDNPEGISYEQAEKLRRRKEEGRIKIEERTFTKVEGETIHGKMIDGVFVPDDNPVGRMEANLDSLREEEREKKRGI